MRQRKGEAETQQMEKLTRAVVAELCRNVTIYGSCRLEEKGQVMAMQ